MTLNVRALTLASGAVAAVLFALCALAVAVSPAGFMAAVGYISHADLSALARPITWGSFVVGLVSWTALTMVVVGAAAATYNRLIPARGPSAVTIAREERLEKAER